MRRMTAVALVALGMLLFAAIRPPRAEAVDIEESLIIAGATAGAAALIAFIAILASDKDEEPDFLAEAPRRPDRDPGMRLGFRAVRFCPPDHGNISLACW
jgi:hypothetical protein